MNDIGSILNARFALYNQSGFIKDDPISIPHRFTKKEDIEIMSFLISTIAWGQRISIIRSGDLLCSLFSNQPHAFILNHSENDLKSCLRFVHRTFNGEDLISFIGFLNEIYSIHGGLENAFSQHILPEDRTVENALNGFRKLYNASEYYLDRTSKHIAHPNGGSACKRLNMFLRWMVRKDKSGVDFGIWKSIKPSALICPLDVHVIREAFQLKLIKSEKSNWKTALELTESLRKFDSEDPVKYDIALFGMGIDRKTQSAVQLHFK